MSGERAFRRGTWRKRAAWLVTLLALAGLAIAAWSFASARADPLVRRMTVKLPRWPVGAVPVRVLVWSDLHLGNPATGPARLARLIDRANALQPDLVVLAGDYIAGHERKDAGVAPGLAALRELDAPVVAVMGNHEYWTDAPRVRAVLERAGVTVLTNAAVRRGPLAVGGVDDLVVEREDVAGTAAAMRRIGGAPLMITHSPDLARTVPADMPLLVAGHTHCGQIVLPLWGPPIEASESRYRCGIVREEGKLIVVTAGTGTSVLPFRFGAPPDWWLLTLGP